MYTEKQFVDGNPSLDRPRPVEESGGLWGHGHADADTLNSMGGCRPKVCEGYAGGICGWEQGLTFQPSGPRREPRMSQATTVPTIEPAAPMMKAPKVLLAALSSLQHGVKVGSSWGQQRHKMQ